MDFSLCFPTRTSNNIAIFLLNFDDVGAIKRNSRCIANPNLNVVSFILIFSAQTKWVPIHCKSKWIKCWRYSNSSPRCRCGRSTNTCNSRIVASRRNFEHILPKCRCKGNGFTIVVRKVKCRVFTFILSLIHFFVVFIWFADWTSAIRKSKWNNGTSLKPESATLHRFQATIDNQSTVTPQVQWSLFCVSVWTIFRFQKKHCDEISFFLLKIADDNPNPLARAIKNEIVIEIEDDGNGDQNGTQSGNQTAELNKNSVQKDAVADNGNGNANGPKRRNNVEPVVRLDRCDSEERAKRGAKKTKQRRHRWI